MKYAGIYPLSKHLTLAIGRILTPVAQPWIEQVQQHRKLH